MAKNNPITDIWLHTYQDFICADIWRGDKQRSYAIYDHRSGQNRARRFNRLIKIQSALSLNVLSKMEAIAAQRR